MNGEQHVIEHVSADGFIDYVLVMFHVDLGEDHMEVFEGGHTSDIEMSSTDVLSPVMVFLPYSNPPLLLESANSRVHRLEHDIPVLRRYVIGSLNFRGPPHTA